MEIKANLSQSLVEVEAELGNSGLFAAFSQANNYLSDLFGK